MGLPISNSFTNVEFSAIQNATPLLLGSISYALKLTANFSETSSREML